jgi:hypothetical protein
VLTKAVLNKINHADTLENISLIYILVLSSHLRRILPSGLFPSGFLTEIVYEFLIFQPVLHVLSISFMLI